MRALPALIAVLLAGFYFAIPFLVLLARRNKYNTDRLLAVHIVGPRASELIAECVAVLEYHGSAEDIARCAHAHPTLSEAVGEAARAAWAGAGVNF